VTPDPRDEARHEAGAAGWCEVFALDFVAPEVRTAGAVTVSFFPRTRSCSFWACLVGADRQFLTIVEHDVGAPRGLELRAPGLWVDLQCLVPYDHVTLGLDAFAVALDDPSEALGRLWGDRVPFGLDLEWDTAGPVDARPTGTSAGCDGYEIACRVHGEVLVADERLDIDGFGSRRHLWGATHPWATPWARAVTTAGTGDPPVPDAVLAEAPLLVRLDDGTCFRLDRTLAVVHDAAAGDAPDGLAWIERNQPC